jgi:hypothetical protein
VFGNWIRSNPHSVVFLGRLFQQPAPEQNFQAALWLDRVQLHQHTERFVTSYYPWSISRPKFSNGNGFGISS